MNSKLVSIVTQRVLMSALLLVACGVIGALLGGWIAASFFMRMSLVFCIGWAVVEVSLYMECNWEYLWSEYVEKRNRGGEDDV